MPQKVIDSLQQVGSRFKEYLDYKRIGVNKAGDIMGVNGGQVSNIIRGYRYGTDKLLIILHKFGDLNESWLLRGEGAMLKIDYEEKAATIEQDSAMMPGSIEWMVTHYESLKPSYIHKAFITLARCFLNIKGLRKNEAKLMADAQKELEALQRIDDELTERGIL